MIINVYNMFCMWLHMQTLHTYTKILIIILYIYTVYIHMHHSHHIHAYLHTYVSTYMDIGMFKLTMRVLRFLGPWLLTCSLSRHEVSSSDLWSVNWGALLWVRCHPQTSVWCPRAANFPPFDQLMSCSQWPSRWDAKEELFNSIAH